MPTAHQLAPSLTRPIPAAHQQAPSAANRSGHSRTATATVLRIGLIAADPITRAGIASLVDARSDICLLPDARRAESALLVIVEKTVDSVLLGTVSSYADGGRTPVCAVIDEPGDAGLLPAAAESGLGGMILRDESTPALLAAFLHRVHEISVCSGGTTGRLDALRGDQARLDRANHREAAHRFDLDKRETMILRMLADGLGTAEIASLMGFSESTIKNALSSVLQRNDLRNRIHAVTRALRRGMI